MCSSSVHCKVYWILYFYPGPQDEIEFWKIRMCRLTLLMDQLRYWDVYNQYTSLTVVIRSRFPKDICCVYMINDFLMIINFNFYIFTKILGQNKHKSNKNSHVASVPTHLSDCCIYLSASLSQFGKTWKRIFLKPHVHVKKEHGEYHGTQPIVATEFSSNFLNEHPAYCIINSWINLTPECGATSSIGGVYSCIWFLEIIIMSV